MAAGASARLEDLGPDQSPLVAVTLQRDVHRKKKYLEAEPKALGITQLGLSIYVITCTLVFLSQRLDSTEDIALFILSPLVMIAGILAIVAQNLHLPTKGLKVFCAGGILIQAALFAISVTLACYCCKAANCCCPDRKMPVIAIYAPPAKPQEPAQRYDCMCIGGFTSGRTKDSNLQKITRRCEICLFVPKKMPRRDFRFINE
ncbi:uncharacterized protein KZ484_003965 isoform 5-T6 [Pholidichthys leucotaenia]